MKNLKSGDVWFRTLLLSGVWEARTPASSACRADVLAN